MRAELREKLSDVGAVVEELKASSERVGAILIFLGVVRGISHGKRVLRLEYEAHDVLAPQVLRQLLEEAREKHGIIDGVIEHKVGVAGVGEPVMCVAIASEHRREGFRALLELVDRVKHEAPIWKKEVTEEGARWVEERGARPPIKLASVLEAVVNEELTARELVVRLGLRPEDVFVMREGRIVRPDELLREGEFIRIVPARQLKETA